MAFRTSVCIFAAGVLAMVLCGCGTTKDIDEKYLVVSSITVTPDEDDRSVLTLKIEGDYAESAWGIKSIEQETVGNTIVLTGTLVSEGQGAFEYEVRIPPHVDAVKFNERVLWTRNQ